MSKLSLKTRRRRTSSGEKTFEKGRSRLSSCDSYSEESGNESDNEDKMSFKDFEIEERQDEDQNDEDVKKESPEKEAEPDKTFFNDLLNQKPILTTDINKNEKKKQSSGRISQKERKRLSREAAEVKEDSPSPTKSSWSGWGSVNPSSAPSSSSLADIMRLETKSPPQEKTKTTKSDK